MNDEELNSAVIQRASVAPRVTLEEIEGQITDTKYFLAGDGVYGDAHKRGDHSIQTFPAALDVLTFCILTLANGYTVVGKSACACPENFDAEIGREYARRDAISQCWPLFGFRLRDKLAYQASIEAQQPSLT